MSRVSEALDEAKSRPCPLGLAEDEWKKITGSPGFQYGFYRGWAANTERHTIELARQSMYDRYVEIMNRDLSPAEKGTLLVDVDEGVLLRILALRIEEFWKREREGA